MKLFFKGHANRKKTFRNTTETEIDFTNIDLSKATYVAASNFATKVSLISVAFLLFYSVLPSYVFSANQTDFLTIDEFDHTPENDTFITVEEGFLVKPSIITEKSDKTQFSEAISYEVQQGDTLSEIATNFGVKTNTILENNTIANPNALKTGTILTILPIDGILHTIKKGDTPASLAKTYQVKEETIIAQNKLAKGETLQDGTKIIIPGGKKIVPRYIASRDSANRGSYQGAGYGTITETYNGNISQSLIKPAAGQITQYYHSGHYAIDIGNRNKGPILAAANGVVIKAQGGYNGGYGNMIIIDHGNGRETLYAHNSALYVKVGDTVTQGQTIAWMGNTGRVYGPTGIHLHFELRINGRKVNPLLYIK